MTTRPRTVKHKNITRIDHPKRNTYGYFVRIRWKNERRSKFFSDNVHGDRLGALFAAIEWRDQTEKELGKPRTERLVIGTPHTTSGIVGVRQVRENQTDYYEATWTTHVGKLNRTKYSINKHGPKKALRLAIKARERGEKERLFTPASPED